MLYIIFRQIQRHFGPRLIYALYASGIISPITLDILRYICPYSGILLDSGIFRILAQLDMLMYIKACILRHVYSEPVDIFSQSQTQEQFMNILSLI